MTSQISDQTKITILVSGEITDVPATKLFKLLRKHGLRVTEVLAERVQS